MKFCAWRHAILCMEALNSERFQCFLSNMLDIGNILKTTCFRFQKEKLTIGECKDEFMVAIGQFTLLLDGEGHRFSRNMRPPCNLTKTPL